MNNMSLIDGTKVVKGGGKAKYIVCVLVAVTCLIVGIVVGRYGLCGTPDGVFLPGVSETINKDGDADVGKRLMDSISNTEIEDNLRYVKCIRCRCCLELFEHHENNVHGTFVL